MTCITQPAPAAARHAAAPDCGHRKAQQANSSSADSCAALQTPGPSKTQTFERSHQSKAAIFELRAPRALIAQLKALHQRTAQSTAPAPRTRQNKWPSASPSPSRSRWQSSRRRRLDNQNPSRRRRPRAPSSCWRTARRLEPSSPRRRPRRSRGHIRSDHRRSGSPRTRRCSI